MGRSEALLVAVVTLCVCISMAYAGASKDMPNPPSNLQKITAGSLVIPMDSKQNLNGVFNIKAYGFAVHLLWNEIPLYWAIRAGKLKDAKDFSGVAQQVYPTTGSAGNVDYYAGPLIILKVNADKALALAKKWQGGSSGVVIHKLTADALDVDIRHEIFTKPKILISNLSGYSQTQTRILNAAGIELNTHYIITDTDGAITALNEASCYTFFSEPHYIWNDKAPGYYDSVGKFVNSGGNFLAECAGAWSYENYNPSTQRGGFQSIAGLYYSPTSNTQLKYPNPDVPYNQFQGDLDGVNSGHTPDYCFYPPSNIGNTQVDEATEKSWLINNAFYVVINDPAKAKCTNGQTRVIASVSKPGQGTGIGGLVFYLGAHDWSDANAVNRVAGKRLYLNALLTPAKRFPVCEFDFCPPGQECPHDECHTCVCNDDGAAVVTKIDGCCLGDTDCGSCQACENKKCVAECGNSAAGCTECNTGTNRCDPVPCPCSVDTDCAPCYSCEDDGSGSGAKACTLISTTCCTDNADCAPCGYCDFDNPIKPSRLTKDYFVCKRTPNCCEDNGDCDDCQTCDTTNNICRSDCTSCQTCESGSCKDVSGCCFIDTQCSDCQVCDFGVSECIDCPTCTKCSGKTCDPVPGCCILDDECTGACQKCTDNECQSTITGELGSCCVEADDCKTEGTTCASFGTCEVVCKDDSDCADCQGCVDGVCQDSSDCDDDGKGGDGGSDAARITLGLSELL